MEALAQSPYQSPGEVKILEQKVSELLGLELGFEMIDHGFFLVRVYKDYLHVLPNGPWVERGHYLTVCKRRPNNHQSLFHLPQSGCVSQRSRLNLLMNLILVGRNWSKQSGLINAQWIPLGVYMHVCVEVDFKKQRVPSFVLMMTSRGSNTKACILYAFECGEYGHRIELCPKLNTFLFLPIFRMPHRAFNIEGKSCVPVIRTPFFHVFLRSGGARENNLRTRILKASIQSLFSGK